MPVNRNALIRYKTIDKCLQNRFRKWTLEDLIDACSDALYDFEGIDKGVSKRTIQSDIQMMRSDKLGYNAPIIVVDRKYYAYEDKDYSITNIPITEQDLNQLNETVELLKQFKGFSHFRELDGMVQKLEDHVYAQKNKQKQVIDFEKNDHLKGLSYLDVLYRSIINKYAVRITYQSFKARQAQTFDFHPYLLKEFRNRWFLVGIKKRGTALLNLALDRILDIEKSDVTYVLRPDFDPEEYYRYTFGASVHQNQEPVEIILFVTHQHAPYVLTKPFHWTQQLISKDLYGITISLKVHYNFEIEKEILGFGDGIKVIAPQRLRRNVKDRLEAGLENYLTELSKKGLVSAQAKLIKNGFSILNSVFSHREIKKIKHVLSQYFKETGESSYGKRLLLKDIPALKQHLFTANLITIVKAMDPKAFLVKAILFDKPATHNWYVTWHQDIPINVNQRTEHEGYAAWTRKEGIHSVCPPLEISKNIFAIRIHLDDTTSSNGGLHLIPGSHKGRLSDQEIKTITENSQPFERDMAASDVLIMKPLLLHKSLKSVRQKRRRVIHLEFASVELPGQLDWLEREKVEAIP